MRQVKTRDACLFRKNDTGGWFVYWLHGSGMAERLHGAGNAPPCARHDMRTCDTGKTEAMSVSPAPSVPKGLPRDILIFPVLLTPETTSVSTTAIGTRLSNAASRLPHISTRICLPVLFPSLLSVSCLYLCLRILSLSLVSLFLSLLVPRGYTFSAQRASLTGCNLRHQSRHLIHVDCSRKRNSDSRTTGLRASYTRKIKETANRNRRGGR